MNNLKYASQLHGSEGATQAGPSAATEACGMRLEAVLQTRQAWSTLAEVCRLH